jgi:hypothetical protein
MTWRNWFPINAFKSLCLKPPTNFSKAGLAYYHSEQGF